VPPALPPASGTAAFAHPTLHVSPVAPVAVVTPGYICHVVRHTLLKLLSSGQTLGHV
jgi:hypothetical protein